MVYLYTSFLNQINVYDYPTRFLFQNVTSFSVSVSDQILRKRETKVERERGKFVKRGKKRKESSCRVQGSTPLPFSLFRRKEKEEGERGE